MNFLFLILITIKAYFFHTEAQSVLLNYVAFLFACLKERLKLQLFFFFLFSCISMGPSSVSHGL